LLLNKSNIPDKKVPKYTLNFEFNDISLMAEEEQYKQLVALLDWFTIYSKGIKVLLNMYGAEITRSITKLVQLSGQQVTPKLGGTLLVRSCAYIILIE
jgi:hypothetical protein